MRGRLTNDVTPEEIIVMRDLIIEKIGMKQFLYEITTLRACHVIDSLSLNDAIRMLFDTFK